METVQLLTMIVLVGFTSPVDGEFAPVSYTFYQATKAQRLKEQDAHRTGSTRVLCLRPGEGDRRTIPDLLKEIG